ncbi:hypothetical protein DCC79_06845 [bacterium]|nr:MAG: hypothetical protein DCC79_06845 [bacterium]
MPKTTQAVTTSAVRGRIHHLRGPGVGRRATRARTAGPWRLAPILVAAGLALGGARDAAAQIGLLGGPPQAVSVRAVAERARVAPGDRLAVAVVLDYAESYHSWPNPPIIPPEFGADFPAIPTTIDIVQVPEGVKVGRVQWPAPVAVTVDYGTGPIELMSYAGRTVAYVPVVADTDAAEGPATLDLLVGYQACDETTCYPPESLAVQAAFEIAAAGGSSAPPADPALFTGFDPAGFDVAQAAAAGGASGDVAVNVFGRTLRFSPEGGLGLGLLLLTAALGGMLLNFTPCVLPVLPLKAMALGRAAGSRDRLVVLGASMALGVVMFWLVIGGAIAFIAGFNSISSLFQTGWFSLVVGLVVAVMAVGMLGVFEVNAPQWAYAVNPSQDTLQGSFLFGVMTAVLSTPCTAPFMGSAAAWAALQAPPVTLATFAAIGAGMALPYLLLSLFPRGVNAVPRSGAAALVVRQVMGLFMLAVAVFFLGVPLASYLQTPPDPATRAYWYAVVFFVVAACGWMAFRTFQITPAWSKRAAFGGLGLALATASLWAVRDLASQGPIPWVYYTPERFAAAAARGDVVVVDFTAEWCLNCKALEAGVLHQPPVVDLLQQPGVTPMKIDLTGDNPTGRAKLKELDWVGIPLLAVYGPATGYDDTALKFDSYTAGTVEDALAAARQVAAGAAPE